MPESARNVIAVKLGGGLGNQLFHYAAGLLVASRFPEADLRVNVSTYGPGSDPDRPLLLGAFGIPLRPWRSRGWRVEQFIRDVSHGHIRVGVETLIETQSFEPRLFDISPPCQLRGYFQSWRYVEPISDLVRRTYKTDALSTERIASMESRIAEASCPVLVHVRRGDYETTGFPLKQRDYYDRARAEIEKRCERPTYFLFSDDLRQAQSLLADWPDVVPVEGFSSLEDFRLMSLCRHFIIANSTFSWWATWLGAGPDSVVVAPTVWQAGEAARTFVLDNLLPPAWIRVEG